MTAPTPIRFEHQGVALLGQAALPAGAGAHPAVLVMHNAHGIGPHMLEIAQRLAERGYVAVAADMYGGGAYHEDRKRAGEAIAPLWADPHLLRARVLGWCERVKSMPEVDAARVAAIGYCFGGQCVLELARGGADVKAAISYHGLLKTASPARRDTLRAYVAVFTGTLDPYAPHSDVAAFREEMIEAGARWQITEFGGAYHSFTDYRLPTEPALGLAYDARAERESWASTLAILSEVLAGGDTHSSHVRR